MEPVPAPQIPSPSDISTVGQTAPSQSTEENTPPKGKSRHNLNPMLLVITVLAVIIAIGSLFYAYTVTQRYQSELPSDNSTPEATTTLDSTTTVVTTYKTVILDVGKVSSKYVQVQLSIPETWSFKEVSRHTETEGIDSGIEFITYELKAGNEAVLTISNVNVDWQTSLGLQEESAVFIQNLTNLLPKQQNVVPIALYRLFDQNTGAYAYFTAEKGKYLHTGSENGDVLEADGWNYPGNFIRLLYYKELENELNLTAYLTYTGSPEKKDEFLALFDKVMQSLEVL